MHLQSKSLSLSIKLSYLVIYYVVLYNMLKINILYDIVSACRAFCVPLYWWKPHGLGHKRGYGVFSFGILVTDRVKVDLPMVLGVGVRSSYEVNIPIQKERTNKQK